MRGVAAGWDLRSHPEGVRRPIVPVRYFTNAGRESGPILLADHYDSIDVFGDPGDGPPIGMALPGGSTEGGIVIWEIVIRGVTVPGRWIVLGRRFLPKT
jgi:hypothetical protein